MHAGLEETRRRKVRSALRRQRDLASAKQTSLEVVQKILVEERITLKTRRDALHEQKERLHELQISLNEQEKTLALQRRRLDIARTKLGENPRPPDSRPYFWG